MSIAALIQKPSFRRVATATVATPATHGANARAQPRVEVRSVANVASVAVANPPNAESTPPRAWLVTTPEGEVFSLSRTPPATLAEIRADYPGALVEPEPAPGAALRPDDMALAYALLRQWGETDTGIGQEWIDGLAAKPERLKQIYAEAVRLGIATYDPAPEAIATATVATSATGAVCARCGHWAPSPINPEGGMGQCLTASPTSRRPGACWPWPDADVRCEHFEPKSTEIPTL
ncbi:hypothetical protein [Thiocapsa rosea]|uniref:Uncharacterized protein n=1 Tax=Thiocapsa rosea TaxID=69360 RepID=A0A495VDE9_9GAMM|nr:hypothetical protein [Thiocapsa rosea]RKT46810.1 hypothetical protein BDD21_4348 [Thiocapsa rosea]